MTKSKYIVLGLIPSLFAAGITDKINNAYADSTRINRVNAAEQSAAEQWMENYLPGYLNECEEVDIINQSIRDSINVVDAKARAARIQIPVVYNRKTYFPDGSSRRGRHPILIKRLSHSVNAAALKEHELELKLSQTPSLPLESDRDPDKLDLFISRMKQYPILRRLLE